MYFVMKQQLLDFIKQLSLKDKKNLTQKALKASEEVGELAKAVLPYENAYATTHRFVAKEKILQEAVDVILTALSVAYDIGATDEDIEEMMHRKSSHWAELQAREDQVNYPLPFEIHVTVKNPSDIEKFKSDCKEIDVKPIVIDLQDGNSQTIMLDVMTSSVFYGENAGAYNKAWEISFFLKERGYDVVRQKIETIPWHPAAPSDKHANPFMPKNCYFESHIQIITTTDRKSELEVIAHKNSAHLSRNFFKKVSDNEYIIMLTLRKKEGTYEKFTKELEVLKSDVLAANFVTKKIEVEFSIYDTNLSHDYNWINKEVHGSK